MSDFWLKSEAIHRSEFLAVFLIVAEDLRREPGRGSYVWPSHTAAGNGAFVDLLPLSDGCIAAAHLSYTFIVLC